MKYQKGISGNPVGRPKGAKDKATQDLRTRVNQLLELQFDQVVEDLANLDPKDRVNTYVRLLEYALPKLQRSETTVDLSKLSDEQVDALFERALNA